MRLFKRITHRAARLVIVLLFCLPGAGIGRANAATSPPMQAPTLFIIGDSTVNNHSNGLLGWGDPISAYFDPARIHVVNRARGGRSSRTYQSEGLWDQVAALLKPGDFVLIQFGHNDGGSLVQNRTRASLHGVG